MLEAKELYDSEESTWSDYLNIVIPLKDIWELVTGGGSDDE